MKLFRTFLSLLALTIPLLAGTANGQVQDASARRSAFERGEKAIKDKNWAEAERVYMDLWNAQRSYDVALSLGVVELNLKRYADAAQHFDFGLANLPAREKPELVQRMRELFDLAKQQVAAITIVVNKPDAQVYVDSHLFGASPLLSDVYLDVGPHVVNARLGETVTPDTRIDALAGQTRNVQLTIESPPVNVESPPVTPIDPGGGGQSLPDQQHAGRNYVPAIVAASVGGVALTGGIIALVVSLNKHADAQRRLDELGDPNACGPGMSAEHADSCHEIAQQADSSHTFRALSFAGFGTAIAAGAITYVLWPKSRPQKAAFEPSINVSRESFVAALRGNF
jgi:hypothetical protein